MGQGHPPRGVDGAGAVFAKETSGAGVARMAPMAGRPPLLTPEVVPRAGQCASGAPASRRLARPSASARRSTFRPLAQTRGERHEDHGVQETRPTAGPLTEADLVALLEAAARRGNVRAIELLLRRPWERDRVAPPARRTVIDELAARRPGYPVLDA